MHVQGQLSSDLKCILSPHLNSLQLHAYQQRLLDSILPVGEATSRSCIWLRPSSRKFPTCSRGCLPAPPAAVLHALNLLQAACTKDYNCGRPAAIFYGELLDLA